MAENTYIELKDNINNEYIFVKNIKNTASMLINVLESRVMGKRILVKYYDGNIDAYQKLLGVTLPNIPTVYNVVCEDGKCIVVEDYIDGITIDEMLEVGRYSSKEVEKIILELCDALDSIHKMGIVHRDIKPENIIIDNSGKAWLIDFNISRLDKEDQNKDTVMLGTT